MKLMLVATALWAVSVVAGGTMNDGHRAVATPDSGRSNNL